MPEPLRLGVRLDQRHVRLVAPGEAQVVEGYLVDREHRARGPVLGAHVADGGAGLDREGRDVGAVALHERADDAVVAQQLGDRQHDVGGGDAGLGLAADAQPHDRRQQHRERLAEHGRLRLDPADAPTEHAEAVDHRRVRVGADERVAERAPVLGGEHEARQVLEVDLVADAGARRDDAEAVEGTLGPAQQLVALHVALVLDRHVAVVGLRIARALDDHRVVDDELDGHERVDPRRIPAQPGQRLAHGREVDDAGHAREVLHEDALGREGDLVGGVPGPLPVSLGVLAPGGHGDDVVGRHMGAVLVAQQVLEDDLDGVRQAVDVVALGQCGRLDVEDLVAAVADGQIRPGAEGVGVCGGRFGGHALILPWVPRYCPRGPRARYCGGLCGDLLVRRAFEEAGLLETLFRGVLPTRSLRVPGDLAVGTRQRSCPHTAR